MMSQSHLWPGALAGAVAGVVMAAAMMGYMLVRQQSVWTNPNLIAVMWLGPEAESGGFGTATIVGFATHMAASMLMGVIGVPFIAALPRGRTVLAAFAYALASYPVAMALVMTWANPLFVERTQMVPMTMAHIVFGLVYGWTFLALVGRSDRRKSHSRRSTSRASGTTTGVSSRWTVAAAMPATAMFLTRCVAGGSTYFRARRQSKGRRARSQKK